MEEIRVRVSLETLTQGCDLWFGNHWLTSLTVAAELSEAFPHTHYQKTKPQTKCFTCVSQSWMFTYYNWVVCELHITRRKKWYTCVYAFVDFCLYYLSTYNVALKAVIFLVIKQTELKSSQRCCNKHIYSHFVNHRQSITNRGKNTFLR